MFFELVAMLGTNTYLVKTIAREPARAGIYVYNTILMKLVLGFALSVLAVVLAYALGYSPAVRTIVLLGCLALMTLGPNDALLAGLQGLVRMARPAAWVVVQQYIVSGLGIFVLLTHANLTLYAATLSCFGFITLVPYVYYLRPEFSGQCTLDLRIWRRVLVGGLPFATWAAVSLIYGSIDILMLQAMTDDATVGWYGVAWAWVGFPAFFSSIVVTVFFPALSQHGDRDTTHFASLANSAMRLVVFVGAPAAAGIALIAGPMLDLLYPPEYHNAVPLLQILALHIPFVAMDMILGIALVARDRQRAWLLLGCAAAIFNPLINLVLIPLSVHAFSNGAVGAAIATVATEGLMMAGAIALRPSGVLDRSTVRYLARCFAAAAVILPVGLLFRGQPLFLQIVIGVLVYAVASFTFRTVTPGLVRSVYERGRATISARRSDANATSSDGAVV
jgi:O-antigen/teichoic acid export membrane protein